ncbi:MAG: DegT/DnrJ/EryC1/StrS family aminotransferase [Thermoguttaceae bacterium]
MANKLAIHGGDPVCKQPFPAWPIFGEEEETALLRALRSGQWGRLAGNEVAQFEKAFGDFQQAKHGIAVVNGTVALRLALIAGGIEAGDEVIVPPYTFLATASAVVEANAVPVFADIEQDTFNIDPTKIEALITPKTKAIIVVHLGGLPVDLDAFTEIARRHKLLLVEDAAHAHGAEYRGRRVGALGDMGTFSFQSSKNLCSGEGGIIVTNNDRLAERCRSIHNCGRIAGGAWYEHHTIGGNYRLSEFQGAVLSAQFTRLPQQIETREENARYLAGRLSQLPGILPQARGPQCTRHSYHLFTFRLDTAKLGVSREAFLKALTAEGVPASGGYLIPLYRQPMFVNLAFGPYTGYRATHPNLDYRQVQCPTCDRICTAEGAWLEQRLLLGTRKDMDDIAGAFEKIVENRNLLRT